MGRQAHVVESDDNRDQQELEEWSEAFYSVMFNAGSDRAREILSRLQEIAGDSPSDRHTDLITPYVNSITIEKQASFPGDLVLEERLTAIMRWNALVMVMKANLAHADLGGHIASYASAADLFEVGFNHFFRAGDSHPESQPDLVYFQPHSAPGIYARAFLEGRFTEQDLTYYRQEITARKAGAIGLSSYPHPWLMPDFWQFPTGSMGIGPISSIYQARFLRYLEHRGIKDTAKQRVWGIFGDGEMDEPESLSALTLAAREGLDNLTWVINCNLQRLDGPVRGNSRIVDELEAHFKGAGWHVIKLLWGSDWDKLFKRDTDGILRRTLSATVDGQFQTFAANNGAYNRDNFFGQNASLAQMVSDLSDNQIDRLTRGGHDLEKIYAAFSAAVNHTGKPTVVLAQTKKGYGMGSAGQGKMTTHQQKKMSHEALLAFRDEFNIPLSDEQVENLSFCRPAAGSDEMRYLNRCRQILGGYLPWRRNEAEPVAVPTVAEYGRFALQASGRAMSTTVALVRMLGSLLKDNELGPRVVPIVADEARTFGMASLFRQFGIYSSLGQKYEPEDIGSLLSYREAKDGQILEEGISEAGAISSWVAAATSYAAHGKRMLPFYIFYSMFGFQRIGDHIWSAADQRARGFLIGATSGKTTLGGEGLQHQDGHSHLIASTVPNCRAYDPAFASELAVIIDYGMHAMMEHEEDFFYYVTVTNEVYSQVSLTEDVYPDIIKGMYQYSSLSSQKCQAKVNLLGSGAILKEVIAASEMLRDDWEVGSNVWSVTSYTELAREAATVERWNRFHPGREKQVSHLTQCLRNNDPVIAASDYVRALPQLLSQYIKTDYCVLGTDGFGRSDTRQTLREFFEINRYHIVISALHSLVVQGKISEDVCRKALATYHINVDAAPPWEC